MRVTKVQDVTEAVTLCNQLKKTGKYNWFRGQRKTWPLKSSFIRLDKFQQKEALEQLARFEHWIKNTPGLEPIASNADMAIAVAQHYGLPTNFIDFTTDPVAAGFFASNEDKIEQKKEDYSCILCLDTNDLEDFWRSMPEQYKPPEFIQLSVPNLWRLEAQSGVFLFCPYANFEHIYDLDKIIFPPSRFTGDMPKHGYYPERKSALEVLLDQFFMNEELIEGTQRVESIMSQMSIHSVQSKPNRCDPDIIIGGYLPIHESWSPKNTKKWGIVEPEKLNESVTNEHVHIDLRTTDSPNELGKVLKTIMSKRFKKDSDLRAKLITFTCELTSPDSGEHPTKQELRSVARLWDGLRNLPFTDEEIAIGLVNCLALQVWWLKLGKPRVEDFELVASSCFGDSQWIEFGAADGSYAKAYVGKQMLLNCVRDDISTFLAPKFKDQVEGNIIGMLQGCSDPKRLFNFRLIASLFALQISPVQVLTRGASAVYFSPVRLDSFGLP
jgi:hypothetical protein